MFILKEIKQLNEADYQDVFALSQFAFQYELTEAELVKKGEEADRHNIWGWMEEGELAGKLHIIPLSSYVNGQMFKMGGISSVATWPSYRRKGIVKHLLKHALLQMKKEGQAISFLSPFSVSFYRKFGWELVFTEKQYRIPIEQLKRNWGGKGDVRRMKIAIPLLHRIYTTYAKQYTGMLVRDEKWWEQRIFKDQCEVVVAYNEADEAEGYVMYTVKENIVTVKGMAYTSLNGRKLLLQFIANHDSMAREVNIVVPENDHLPILLEEPTFEQKIEPYFMARIVDVLGFLKQYPLQRNASHENLLLRIVDDFFPENSGTYQLDNEANVEKVTEDVTGGVHCSIQVLTVMFLGYKRPLELYELDLIQGLPEEIEQLEQLIPKQQPFFADYF